MPVETLRPSDGRMAGGPFASAMPFRILNKGPEYFRRAPEPGARKLSAVERLEADKAKYVKSQQVASTKQEPVKPPIIRKPLLSPGMLLQCRVHSPPARKVPRRPADPGGFGGARKGSPLNLEILNNLINVYDGPPASAAKNKPPAVSSSCSSSSSSPLNEQNRRPPPVPARAAKPGAFGSPAGGSPNTVTVRRVDVRPQAEARTPRRTPLQPRAPARQVAQPQAPPPPPQPAPAQPSAPPPVPPLPQPALPASPSPLLLRSPLPPASPAFTRLSSTSSRGSPRDGPGAGRRHPSLHRSKSDLSDRYSRATADLERFFNYCGLDPTEAEGLGVERFARASSDIVSVSKLRSVSTPSSECAGPSQHSDEPPPAQRAPYGISVIERNARVIKWLYGIRQARDAQSVSNV